MIGPRTLVFVTLVVTVVLGLLAVTTMTPTTATAATSALTPLEKLGRSIFFDKNLSLNQNQSCAVCHAPNAGWTGPDGQINKAGAVYEGSIPGAFGDRKPPSSAYATQSPVLHFEMEDGEALFVGGSFWDGRATGERLGSPAAEQALGPFLNPKEQALPDGACVVYRVCTATDYPVPFEHAACAIDWAATNVETVCTQGGAVNLSAADRATSNAAYDQIGFAIAAYEGSYKSNEFTSKYDAALLGLARLTGQERRGLELFTGKAQCSACHILDGASGTLFTDYTYDNLGLPKNPQNPATVANPAWSDPGLGGYLATRSDYASYANDNLGKHKVPTLRNIDRRPSVRTTKAFGHNGYFKTLEGIVHFYNTRDVLPVCPGAYTEAQALKAKCWPAPEVAVNVNTTELGNLGLNQGEEKAIVAFLKTLSDGYLRQAGAADADEFMPEIEAGIQQQDRFFPLVTGE